MLFDKLTRSLLDEGSKPMTSGHAAHENPSSASISCKGERTWLALGELRVTEPPAPAAAGLANSPRSSSGDGPAPPPALAPPPVRGVSSDMSSSGAGPPSAPAASASALNACRGHGHPRHQGRWVSHNSVLNAGQWQGLHGREVCSTCPKLHHFWCRFVISQNHRHDGRGYQTRGRKQALSRRPGGRPPTQKSNIRDPQTAKGSPKRTALVGSGSRDSAMESARSDL